MRFKRVFFNFKTLGLTVSVVRSARDLGFVINTRLTIAHHASSVCCSAYCHLRQIRPILRSLSEDAAVQRR